MRDLLRQRMPPEVKVLYAAGIACDLPDGRSDGELICISNSIHLCYGVLNIYDMRVMDTEPGATNPRAEIKRLPTTVVERIRREGHPRYVFVDPLDSNEHSCVGTIKRPLVIINPVKRRHRQPNLRLVA